MREERLFWPGHGGPVTDPARFLRALVGHRRMREAAILARLAAGDRTIPEIVLANYEGLAPGLRGAAALSTLAHLEDLVGRGLARVADGEPALDAVFVPT
jgi:glyoxylase-like metal-dependent hydrolase (beta-lactamase superfamily II)